MIFMKTKTNKGEKMTNYEKGIQMYNDTKKAFESKQVTVTVIHDCNKCNDEGCYVIYDELVKCDQCDEFKSQEDVNNWLYIDNNGSPRVKEGIHLTKKPNQSWEKI